MAKAKKSSTSKRSVKVKDMSPKKNAKGGLNYSKIVVDYSIKK